jgi:hypothetical protein
VRVGVGIRFFVAVIRPVWVAKGLLLAVRREDAEAIGVFVCLDAVAVQGSDAETVADFLVSDAASELDSDDAWVIDAWNVREDVSVPVRDSTRDFDGVRDDVTPVADTFSRADCVGADMVTLGVRIGVLLPLSCNVGVAELLAGDKELEGVCVDLDTRLLVDGVAVPRDIDGVWVDFDTCLESEGVALPAVSDGVWVDLLRNIVADGVILPAVWDRCGVQDSVEVFTDTEGVRDVRETSRGDNEPNDIVDENEPLEVMLDADRDTLRELDGVRELRDTTANVLVTDPLDAVTDEVTDRVSVDWDAVALRCDRVGVRVWIGSIRSSIDAAHDAAGSVSAEATARTAGDAHTVATVPLGENVSQTLSPCTATEAVILERLPYISA